MNTETDVIDTTAVVVTVIPTEQLAEINATEQGLAQLRSRASELAALGVPQSKEAYDEVHRITMVSVKVRTESDKLAKRLAAPFKEKYDAIRAEGKRIGDHAAQSEALTRPLKEAYEAEQERVRIEAEKAAAARIQARVDSLLKIGFVFDGTGYDAYDMRIDAVEVQALPDGEWDALYDSAIVAYTAEVQRLEIIQRANELEAARIESERQAEATRLQKQAEQQQAEAKRLADERAKFEKEQANFRAEQQRVADEQARNEADRLNGVFSERKAQLVLVGYKEDGQVIYFPGTGKTLTSDWLKSATDSAIGGLINEAVTLNQQREADQKANEKAAADEAKAKQKADKERTDRLKGDKKDLLAYLKVFKAGNLVHDYQPEVAELYSQFSAEIDELVARYQIKVTAL